MPPIETLTHLRDRRSKIAVCSTPAKQPQLTDDWSEATCPACQRIYAAQANGTRAVA